MNIRAILFIIVLTLAFIGMYYIGKKSAEEQMQTTLVENYELIKRIAELGTLEVQGNSELDIKPVADGSYISSFKNLFFENSVYLRVPYVAKYGVDLNNIKVDIQHENKEVKITLPHAKLLSYELKLDKISANNKRGWFVLEDDNTYLAVQEKLYKQSREVLDKNQNHIAAAEASLSKLLKDYFKPFGLQAKVEFGVLITPILQARD